MIELKKKLFLSLLNNFVYISEQKYLFPSVCGVDTGDNPDPVSCYLLDNALRVDTINELRQKH